MTEKTKDRESQNHSWSNAKRVLTIALLGLIIWGGSVSLDIFTHNQEIRYRQDIVRGTQTAMVPEIREDLLNLIPREIRSGISPDFNPLTGTLGTSLYLYRDPKTNLAFISISYHPSDQAYDFADLGTIWLSDAIGTAREVKILDCQPIDDPANHPDIEARDLMICATNSDDMPPLLSPIPPEYYATNTGTEYQASDSFVSLSHPVTQSSGDNFSNQPLFPTMGGYLGTDAEGRHLFNMVSGPGGSGGIVINISTNTPQITHLIEATNRTWASPLTDPITITTVFPTYQELEPLFQKMIGDITQGKP